MSRVIDLIRACRLWRSSVDGRPTGLLTDFHNDEVSLVLQAL